MFLQRNHVRNLLAAVGTGYETMQFAMLWLMAYVFLLRLPSEALPVEKGEAVLQSEGQAVFFLEASLSKVAGHASDPCGTSGFQHSVFKIKEPKEPAGRQRIEESLLLCFVGRDVPGTHIVGQFFRKFTSWREALGRNFSIWRSGTLTRDAAQVEGKSR